MITDTGFTDRRQHMVLPTKENNEKKIGFLNNKLQNVEFCFKLRASHKKPDQPISLVFPRHSIQRMDSTGLKSFGACKMWRLDHV